MKQICALVILSALLLGAMPLAAHHSNVGRYQLDRIEEVEGTVAALSLRNPHSVLTVDAVNGEGATTRWNIEFVGITQLRRTGVKLDQLQVGDLVIVGGMAPATAAREIFGRYVVLSHDGRQTPLLGERSLESKWSNLTRSTSPTTARRSPCAWRNMIRCGQFI